MVDKILVVVLGPTASGKTDLGIKLASYYNTEIISADSRQIYKGIYIGTAQPTYEERCIVKHHLIDFVNLDSNYSVAEYEKDSLEILNILFKTKNIVVMVGGTGLYINAVCKGLDKIPNIHSDIEKDVNLKYNNFGLEACVDELKSLDKDCDLKIDLNNKSRVIRALKVIKTTGKPIYSFFGKTKIFRNFNVIYIGIDLEKQILVDRINFRVDKMIENGLIDEVKKFEDYRNFNSLQTIGYKEIFEYFDGKNSLKEAIDNVKLNTKHYAKRQMTWFRKNKNIKWFNDSKLDIVLEYIDNKIGKCL